MLPMTGKAFRLSEVGDDENCAWPPAPPAPELTLFTEAGATTATTAVGSRPWHQPDRRSRRVPLPPPLPWAPVRPAWTSKPIGVVVLLTPATASTAAVVVYLTATGAGRRDSIRCRQATTATTASGAESPRWRRCRCRLLDAAPTDASMLPTPLTLVHRRRSTSGCGPAAGAETLAAIHWCSCCRSSRTSKAHRCCRRLGVPVSFADTAAPPEPPEPTVTDTVAGRRDACMVPQAVLPPPPPPPPPWRCRWHLGGPTRCRRAPTTQTNTVLAPDSLVHAVLR